MMINETDNKISFLTIITGRNKKDALLTALLDSDIHLINTIYGKGTVKANFLRNALGLVPEENKVVITCISTCVKNEIVLRMLEEKFGFNKPNTGIAFTAPIDKVSY
ncbi:MAG: hypothetical protein LBQ00_07425 [Syntrophobacterales bacterium]|jgi:hypothetical protein|nr:hypothetical protein [Syntrophobacterales bacterium]